ncbi:DUF1652 domain-containing protein [Pseudomonas stutzeri]|uniref:DUF1652 domain-containing protein n=1 Tax=Stutzerimonas stutzeri TaxID=316 RepID=UPI0021096406|nr:DUF1652 domain-containing protein [Stutzerimonas stutzeri]MCQ4311659.1 DUF1652 domain-containing protein [Stutzerimonas stutzeri]
MSDALKFEDACRILEASFAPLRCSCRRDEAGKVAIRIFDVSDITRYSISDIEAKRLASIRGVAQMALELRQALSAKEVSQRHKKLKA